MENASDAFLEAVSQSMKAIRAALGATIVEPQLLTAAERLQYEGYLRREETNTIVAELPANGVAIKEIVRRTGRSRKLVRLIVRGDAPTSSVPDRARLIRICHRGGSPKALRKARRMRSASAKPVHNLFELR